MAGRVAWRSTRNSPGRIREWMGGGSRIWVRVYGHGEVKGRGRGKGSMGGGMWGVNYK